MEKVKKKVKMPKKDGQKLFEYSYDFDQIKALATLSKIQQIFIRIFFLNFLVLEIFGF